MNEKSNWFDFDSQTGDWDFAKTKNHIFSPYSHGGYRIGDMSWDDLIRVIAVGYHEREKLARAVIALTDIESVDASDMGLDEVVGLAESLIARVDER